jgi:hypothetical protein
VDEVASLLARVSRSDVILFALDCAERASAAVPERETVAMALEVARAYALESVEPETWPNTVQLVHWADVVQLPERAGIRAVCHALDAARGCDPAEAALRAATCARYSAPSPSVELATQKDELRIRLPIVPGIRGRLSALAAVELGAGSRLGTRIERSRS